MYHILKTNLILLYVLQICYLLFDFKYYTQLCFVTAFPTDSKLLNFEIFYSSTDLQILEF